jgi:hypothetical protein
MLMGMVRSLERPRDTELGHERAAKWLGLRESLRDDDVFADLPPDAIAVWDRFLGYGAALGVAAGAVRALPLGSESDTEAWSSVGGRWRIVRVHYPWRIPPGWGRHPLEVALRGLVTLAFPVLAVFVAWPEIRDNRADLVATGTDHARPWVDRLISIGEVAGLIIAVLVALWALWMLLPGLADLFDRVPHHGRAIRVRTKQKRGLYVALDDGTSNDIRAWRVTRFANVDQGDTIDVVVTRRVGYVRSLAPSS